MFSHREDVEATTLLSNNMTYVSYEFPLPPQMPFPFVKPQNREHFFFTTIMRNPVSRHMSTLHDPGVTKDTTVFFTKDAGLKGPYSRANLALHWLAGILHGKVATEADLQLAKCRLDLFDVVMLDSWLGESLTGVFCNKKHWRWGTCPKPSNRPPKDNIKRIRIGNVTMWAAFVEQNRLSFDLYDYARQLAAKDLVKYGVRKEAPELGSSYLEELESFMDVPNEIRMRVKSALLRSKGVEADRIHDEACAALHDSWAGNADVMPQTLGISIFTDPNRAKPWQ